MSVIVEHTTLESMLVPVTTPTDPTGTPPDFSITTTTASDPGAWVAGSWSGSWDSVTGEIMALSPQLGSAGSLVLSEGQTYQMWIRWTSGSDVPVRDCGTVTAS